jgi:transcriptional regulator with XRE-family HTH domain
MKDIIFAENLKLLMKEHGYNQVRLAKLTGISQSAVSAWLLGKKEPSILSLWLLADLFDTTIDELVGRKLF